MPASRIPRSTVFAFKCKMGTPLTRLDFNLVLRVNDVRQLFYAVHEGVHYVCMRIGSAIPRIRFANALADIERKPLTNFERLDSSKSWSDYIHMGSEVGEGEGKEIRETIRRYWNNSSPAFFQSLSTTTRHNTNLISEGVRVARRQVAPPVDRNSAVIPQPSTPPPSSPSTASLSDSAETLPIIDSPPRSPIPDRSNSTHTVVLPQNGLFSVSQDGGPMHVVEERLRIRDMAMSAIQETFHIESDFNLPARLREMSTQLNQLTNTVNVIKAEILQMRRR